MLQKRLFFFPFTISDGNCDGIPSESENLTEFRHSFPSQIVTEWVISVTNFDGKWRIPSQFCDGNRPVRHNFTPPRRFHRWKLWRTFRHNFRHKIFLWRKTSVTISVTKILWRTVSVTNFPSQKIVTDIFPSQFPSQFVTDPSQTHLWRVKLWRNAFRHKFRHKLKFSVTIYKSFRHNFDFFFVVFSTDWHLVRKFSDRKNRSQEFQTDFLTDTFRWKNPRDRIVMDEILPNKYSDQVSDRLFGNKEYEMWPKNREKIFRSKF